MRNAIEAIGLACAWTIGCGQGPGPRETTASGYPTDGGASAAPVPGQEPDPPSVQVLQELRAIWGSSATDVWAVGENGLAIHFDGHAWTTSNTGTTEALNAVHGTGPSDVWAAGDDGSIYHWDGSAWAAATSGAGTQLLGVWANAPSDVWAVGTDNDFGAGYILHWDGSTWQDADVFDARSFWRIGSSGSNNVWLVGTSANGHGYAMRGQGTHFDPVSFDGGPLRGVWANSADDVWVSSYEGAIAHWDGTTWTPAGPSPASTALLGMSGSGRDDAWAVGLGGAIYHYDGHRWSSVTAQTTAALVSVWCGGRDVAWIVGAATLLRWDGAVWRP